MFFFFDLFRISAPKAFVFVILWIIFIPIVLVSVMLLGDRYNKPGDKIFGQATFQQAIIGTGLFAHSIAYQYTIIMVLKNFFAGGLSSLSDFILTSIFTFLYSAWYLLGTFLVLAFPAAIADAFIARERGESTGRFLLLLLAFLVFLLIVFPGCMATIASDISGYRDLSDLWN